MKYKCIDNQEFEFGNRKIVPIRMQDRHDILKWRNEQIYHLRQVELLTEEKQDYYFENIVSKLFDQEKPSQILFSYLENNICIGYGGLVHINWIDKNAEISFIMDTTLENSEFQLHWHNFLKMIEEVAFNELCFHKIFVFAFDVRPHLYEPLEKAGYNLDEIGRASCWEKV